MSASALSDAQISVVRESFARQTFMVTLGARILAVEPGAVTLGFVRDEAFLQQHGYLHAGVATSVADSACGYAALTLAPVGHEVLTIEFKTNFLRPAAGSRFEARGRVVKPGRTVMFCDGEVWETEPERRLVAKMSATMILQPKA